MKICLIGNNAAGMFAFRFELIEVLVKTYDLYVLTPPGRDADNLEKMGCKLIYTRINRHGTNPFQELALVFQYRNILRKLMPDVVLTYTIKPNIYAGMICRMLKIPYISNITGLGVALERKSILKRICEILYRSGIKKSSAVFFQNKENMNYFVDNHICISKSILIPGSGVNTRRYEYQPYPTNENRLIFLIIGRMMTDKGTNEILQAAKIIHKKHGNVVFRFIGTFDEDYHYKIEMAERADEIEYLGYKEDVREYLRQSHGTISASYHEGMSNVLLESASSGRPVIATDISGSREIFEDGVTGISFKPRDVQSLVDAIEQFLSLSCAEREKMGQRGREKMKREFDKSIVINAYVAEINKLLNK